MPTRSLVDLPKAHLHLHLEGSARPATVAELAARSALDAGALDAVASLPELIERYLLVLASITEPAHLERVCYELLVDEAAQGVRWSEPMVAPQAYVPAFGSMDEVWAIMRAGFDRAAAATGIAWGAIVGHDRGLGPSFAEPLATWAAEHAGDGIVGFGIAGDEAAVGPEPFGDAFDIAAEAGLLLVPHAGETAGPDSVRGALALGANRIAHGVRAVEDPRLLERLAAMGIACDVCPTSNLRLGVVGSLDEHPLPRMLDAGVPVSIGSDDQLFFGSGVADEYEVARAAWGLSDGDLAGIARTSAWASGAPPAVKAAIDAGIDAWLGID